ncbi:MAG: HD domain-containing protein [archaeon]
MDNNQVKEINLFFEKYLEKNLDKEDLRQIRKFEHSYRVANLNKKIAESVNLSDSDQNLTYVIGLLHDIGRFAQLNQTNSFSDSILNHAMLGVKVLDKLNFFEKYNLEDAEIKTIKQCIINHNKYNFEEDDKKISMFIKMIRDSDKVDNLRLYKEEKNIEIIESKDEENIDVSDKVYLDFKKEQSIKSGNINNQLDRCVMVIAFAFDLNFDYSKNIILEENLFDNFYKNIKSNKDANKKKLQNFVKIANQKLKMDLANG